MDKTQIVTIANADEGAKNQVIHTVLVEKRSGTSLWKPVSHETKHAATIQSSRCILVHVSQKYEKAMFTQNLYTNLHDSFIPFFQLQFTFNVIYHSSYFLNRQKLGTT